MNVIICHDGYESRIRELRAAIELLDRENDDSQKDDPFRRAKAVLQQELWNTFDEMCGEGNKYVYTEEEWKNIWKDKEKREKADLTPMKRWNVYLDYD